MNTGENPAPPDGNPMNVLLVEDNAGDVRLTEEAFKDGRIANALYVVNDGSAALDFLHRRGDYVDAPRPHVVLLDLNLPRKSGHEVLKELKSDSELGSIPVIVLTSSNAQQNRVESTAPDADAYLTKPVDPDEFIDTVREFESVWLSIVWASEWDG